MSEERVVVFVVDDDPSMQRALDTLLRSVGLGGRPLYFNNSAAESVTFPGSADERTIGATYS